MIGRYFMDIAGVTIYTDFDIINHPQFREFIAEFEDVPGINALTVSRYKIEVSIGLLFRNYDVMEAVKEVVTKHLGLDSETFHQYDAQDIKDKALGLLDTDHPSTPDINTLLGLNTEMKDA